MFIILLKFSSNKDQMGQYIEGHKKWIKSGFDNDIFLVAGSLQPGLGGIVIAHNTSHDELEDRINLDPFVIENVVSAEILEITPSKTDERLTFIQ